MTFTDRPYLKWRFKTGNKVRSTPVISGNLLVVGSDDGQVYCLDATSGKLQWSLLRQPRFLCVCSADQRRAVALEVQP
jgi:outer membrane protein assembly factor BamB